MRSETMEHKRNNCCLSPVDHLEGKGVLFTDVDRKTCVSVSHVYISSIGDIKVQYVDVLDRKKHGEKLIDVFKRQFPHPVCNVELVAR